MQTNAENNVAEAALSNVEQTSEKFQEENTALQTELEELQSSLEARCSEVQSECYTELEASHSCKADLEEQNLELKALGFDRDAFNAEVNIEKSPGEKLGIKTMKQALEKGETLRITRVAQEGLVADWNKVNPSKAVKAGDCIVSVNGQQDVAQMIQELSRDKTHCICVRGGSAQHVLESMRRLYIEHNNLMCEFHEEREKLTEQLQEATDVEEYKNALWYKSRMSVGSHMKGLVSSMTGNHMKLLPASAAALVVTENAQLRVALKKAEGTPDAKIQRLEHQNQELRAQVEQLETFEKKHEEMRVLAFERETLRITMNLDRSSGTRLGIKSVPVEHARCISSIEPDGLVAAWNAASPSNVVREGDLIVSVNGVIRDPEQISAELAKEQPLEILIRGCSEKEVLNQMKQIRAQHQASLHALKAANESKEELQSMICSLEEERNELRMLAYARHEFEFSLDLDRSSGDKLGIKTIESEQMRCITNIYPEGLVAAWNDANPLKPVREGDLIYSVNDVGGDAQRISNELGQKKPLQIKIKGCNDKQLLERMKQLHLKQSELCNGLQATSEAAYAKEKELQSAIVNLESESKELRSLAFDRENLEFDLKIDRSSGAKLGIKTVPDKASRRISSIQPDGLIAQWNQANPLKGVRVGDSIVAVNDVLGDADRISEELSKQTQLQIKFTAGTAQDLLEFARELRDENIGLTAMLHKEREQHASFISPTVAKSLRNENASLRDELQRVLSQSYLGTVAMASPISPRSPRSPRVPHSVVQLIAENSHLRVLLRTVANQHKEAEQALQQMKNGQSPEGSQELDGALQRLLAKEKEDRQRLFFFEDLLQSEELSQQSSNQQLRVRQAELRARDADLTAKAHDLQKVEMAYAELSARFDGLKQSESPTPTSLQGDFEAEALRTALTENAELQGQILSQEAATKKAANQAEAVRLSLQNQLWSFEDSEDRTLRKQQQALRKQEDALHDEVSALKQQLCMMEDKEAGTRPPLSKFDTTNQIQRQLFQSEAEAQLQRELGDEVAARLQEKLGEQEEELRGIRKSLNQTQQQGEQWRCEALQYDKEIRNELNDVRNMRQEVLNLRQSLLQTECDRDYQAEQTQKMLLANEAGVKRNADLEASLQAETQVALKALGQMNTIEVAGELWRAEAAQAEQQMKQEVSQVNRQRNDIEKITQRAQSDNANLQNEILALRRKLGTVEQDAVQQQERWRSLAEGTAATAVTKLEFKLRDAQEQTRRALSGDEVAAEQLKATKAEMQSMKTNADQHSASLQQQIGMHQKRAADRERELIQRQAEVDILRKSLQAEQAEVKQRHRGVSYSMEAADQREAELRQQLRKQQSEVGQLRTSLDAEQLRREQAQQAAAKEIEETKMQREEVGFLRNEVGCFQGAVNAAEDNLRSGRPRTANTLDADGAEARRLQSAQVREQLGALRQRQQQRQEQLKSPLTAPSLSNVMVNQPQSPTSSPTASASTPSSVSATRTRTQLDNLLQRHRARAGEFSSIGSPGTPGYLG